MPENNQVCLITGPTEGIGKATAEALAAMGYRLILLCRNPGKAAALKQSLDDVAEQSVDVVICDLANNHSVRAAANEILDQHGKLDILINNAGIIQNHRQTNTAGVEMMFATNHLGPFLLTNCLLPLLESSARPRIVNVSSGAHKFVRRLQLDNYNWERGFSTFKAYGHSKLCNLLFTSALVKRVSRSDMAINALHPGAVSTNLGKENGLVAELAYAVLGLFFKTPAQGAASSIWLASHAEAADLRGEYIINCKPAKPSAAALDEEAADRLWDLSAQLTGL